MSGALLAVLAVGVAPAAGAAMPAPARIEVRVTATDPAGGASDVEDAGLTSALAQALIDAGLPATRARDTAATCGDGCLRVRVQRTAAERFLVEVHAPADATRAQVQLAATASPFDLAHALAIQVEVLAQHTRARHRRPRAAPVLAAAMPAATSAQPGAPVVDPASPPMPEARAADAPAANATPAPPTDETTLPYLPPDDAPAVQAAPPPAAPATIDDARLALDVAALMLLAPGSDRMFMHGPTVGARVRIGRTTDLRLGAAFLHPERRSLGGMPFQRELLPLQLVLASQVPRLPGLRVGIGVECVLVGGDDAGRERPTTWSLGAIGRVEYRYPIRSFAVLAAVQTALHPPRWQTGDRDPLPLSDVPPWTVGAALGLELTIF